MSGVGQNGAVGLQPRYPSGGPREQYCVVPHSGRITGCYRGQIRWPGHQRHRPWVRDKRSEFSKVLGTGCARHKMRWAGRVARRLMGNMSTKVLLVKPERKWPLGKPKYRWEDNIKLDLMGIVQEGVDWIYLAQIGTVGEVLSAFGFLKMWEFDYFSQGQIMSLRLITLVGSRNYICSVSSVHLNTCAVTKRLFCL